MNYEINHLFFRRYFCAESCYEINDLFFRRYFCAQQASQNTRLLFLSLKKNDCTFLKQVLWFIQRFILATMCFSARGGTHAHEITQRISHLLLKYPF